MRTRLLGKVKMSDGTTLEINALSRKFLNEGYAAGVSFGKAIRWSGRKLYPTPTQALDYAASKTVIDVRDEFLIVKFEGTEV
jgi:hypothetical protein